MKMLLNKEELRARAVAIMLLQDGRFTIDDMTDIVGDERLVGLRKAIEEIESKLHHGNGGYFVIATEDWQAIHKEAGLE